MLHRIGEGEKITPGVFKSVAQRDQFLPTVHRNSPAVFEIASELFCFDAKVDNVRVGPNEGMKRLDLGHGRSILFPAINLDRAGLAELDRDDARRRIGAEEHGVLFEFHSERFLDFARNDKW